jgi:uncharacterized protein YndB with AHSA1/START domain
MKWVWRILGGIVAVIALAVLALWLAGFREGARRLAATIEISRPAAHVWRYLWDDELMKKWVVGLTEIEHLNEVREGAGGRTKLVQVQGDERVEMEMEITAVEPLRRIAFTLKSTGHPSAGFVETGEYRLTEENGRTRISLATHSSYFPAAIQLMEPLITPQAQKNLDASFAMLKKLAEE